MMDNLTEIRTECDAVKVLGYCSQPQITNWQFEIYEPGHTSTAVVANSCIECR